MMYFVQIWIKVLSVVCLYKQFIFKHNTYTNRKSLKVFTVEWKVICLQVFAEFLLQICLELIASEASGKKRKKK